MRAIIQTHYGAPTDVLELRDVDEPTPADDEVLVRVRATSVHADVWHVVRGLPWVLRLMGSGLRRPRPSVPGIDLAGVVEAVGRDVTRFEVGDAVFGESIRGGQWKNGATFAELATAPAENLAPVPDGVGFKEAVSVPTPGFIALSNLRGATAIEAGQRVLVNGAAGNVGSIALQVAKTRGAHVTGVDHTDKLARMRALGADEVVDYTQRDVTRPLEGEDPRYDLIFDVASTLSVSDCKRIFSEDGRYVVIGHDHWGKKGRRIFGSLPSMFWLIFRSLFNRHIPNPVHSLPPRREVMTELAELLARGALTPHVDETFPLSDAPDALEYLEQGRANGALIIEP